MPGEVDEVEAKPPKQYKPKPCTWCGEDYTPTSAGDRRCHVCRELTPTQAGRCPDCHALVSGRSRWGERWGGECDRAEAIAEHLEDALNGRASLPGGLADTNR